MGKGWAMVLGLAIAAWPVASAAQDSEEPAELRESAETPEPTEVDLEDQEARSLFQAGSLAFSQGRYGEALERFERAHQLSGRPELLFNIAATHDRLRNDAKALEAFERFLGEVPDSSRRAEVEARMEVLRRQIERAEEPAAVPTPEQTARSATPAPEPERVPADEDSGSTWWIWAAGGAVLVGAAVVVVLLLTGGGAQEPLPGDDGVVWTTLRGPP